MRAMPAILSMTVFPRGDGMATIDRSALSRVIAVMNGTEICVSCVVESSIFAFSACS